jgi:hypothetical protein
VGRAALDEDAIRQIEKLNPSIDFDWPRILKGQGDPNSSVQPPPQESKKQEFKKQGPQKHHESQPEQRAERDEEPAARAETVSEPVTPEREIPAHARIGADGVARLRSRYAEVLARVSERVTDPVQKEELKARAERLNPDSWVTDQEVVQGLEEYESTLAGLQVVVGRKRRRRRRGRQADASATATPQEARDLGDDEVAELNGTDEDEGEAVVPSEGPSEEAPEKPEEL